MSLDQIYYYFKPELAPIPAKQAETISEPKNIILPKSEDHESKYAKGLEILQKKMIRHETLQDEDNDFAPVIHEYGLIKKGDGYIFTDQDQTTHEFRTINQAIIYLSKQYKNEDFFAVTVSGDDQNDGNYVVSIKNDTAFTEKFRDEESFLNKIRESIDTRIHGVDWDFQLENQTTGKTDYISEDPANGKLKRYESEATFLDDQDRYYDVQSQTETIRLVEIVHDKEKNKMKAALMQAKDGRIYILDKMLAVCPKSKEEMSEFAPRIETMTVKSSKIGIIIGPGGKQIRSIIEETGVEIDINDDGVVSLSALSASDIKRAKDIIFGLTAEVEIGKIYEGKVTSIVPFGIFVEILPGKEGLCHISELDNFRIENILEYTQGKIKIGDQMNVLAMEINDRGQIKLSRRKALPR